MTEYSRYVEFGSPRRSGKLGRTIDAVTSVVLGGKAVGLFGPAPVVGAIGSAVLGSSPEAPARRLLMPHVPDFCPEGCYWACEHRAGKPAMQPHPWTTRPEPVEVEAATEVDPFRHARRISGPSGLPAAPPRMGTRGL